MLLPRPLLLPLSLVVLGGLASGIAVLFGRGRLCGAALAGPRPLELSPAAWCLDEDDLRHDLRGLRS